MHKPLCIRKRNIVFFICCIIVLVGIFYVLSQNEERITYITDEEKTITGFISDVYKGCEIRQVFEIPKNCSLDFISIQFATYGGNIDENGLMFSLYDDKDELLYEKQIAADELEDNTFYPITFEESLRSESGKYYFIIEGLTNEGEGQAPGIWCAEQTELSSELYVDGAKQENPISAVYKYTKISYGLYIQLALQFVLCLLLSFLNVIQIDKRRLSIFMNILVFLLNFIFIEWWTESFGIQGIEMTWNIRVMTYILMLCIQMVVFGVCGNLYLSIILTDIFLALAAVVNYFVIIYRGVTIVPSDIFSLGTLTTVVGSYPIIFLPRQLVLFMWLFLWLWLSGKLMLGDQYHQKWEKNRKVIAKKVAAALLSICTGITGLFLLSKPEVLEPTGIIPYLWDRNQGYFLNGPFMNFMVNMQYIKIQEPTGYSRELAEQYLAAYQSNESEEEVYPNIIMIMNESLADFESYGNDTISFSQDPLPFIHSLEENTVKGSCYVSIFGSGTSNSEMEALTGHTMANFPSGSIIYQQFPQETTYGIVSSLNRKGYTSIAIHPCTRTNWNRDKVYESMGFSAYYSEEEFEDAEMVRWISDKATYDKIIQLYENKGQNEQLFIFDVTMQGHGGYNSGYVFDTPISVEGSSYPLTEEYLSSTYVSDQAFQYLVEYFEQEEEPTLIFMFGDHQPAVEDEFFEDLLGKSLTDLDLAETQKRYETPYILWANYDIESDTEKDISSNQISEIIKTYAGISGNAYDRFISEFSQEIPVINANGYQDKDGEWYDYSEESPYEELLYQYQVIQYAIYCDGLDPNK